MTQPISGLGGVPSRERKDALAAAERIDSIMGSLAVLRDDLSGLADGLTDAATTTHSIDTRLARVFDVLGTAVRDIRQGDPNEVWPPRNTWVCQEVRYERRGDCDGDEVLVTTSKPGFANSEYPAGTRLALCRSHAQQAFEAGEVSRPLPGSDPDATQEISAVGRCAACGIVRSVKELTNEDDWRCRPGFGCGPWLAAARHVDVPAALRETEPAAVVVRPGDTLMLCYPTSATTVRILEDKKRIEALMPAGAKVAVVAGAIAVTVIRAGGE